MQTTLTVEQCRKLTEYGETRRLDAEAQAYKMTLINQVTAEGEVLRDLRHTWIARDNSGDLWIGFADPRREFPKKRLLNVQNFRAKGFVPMGGGTPVMQLTWNDADSFFLLLGNGSVSRFCNSLKDHGIQLLISGRKKKDAAEALLIFLGREAEVFDIAVSHGWNKKSNGEWHFAGENEKTLKEVPYL